jgi:O-acetyl-ADP-ribose deacetylase (regulator of RNase III)
LVILNSYTQYQWRGAGVKANYAALRQVFRSVKQAYAGRRIGYPALGAGLARGDWTLIAAIIDEELTGEEHGFVQWIK